jgi:hypothetical protein
LQKLVPDDDKAIKKLRWPRNPDLDPQLVWRGKDFEPDPLEVDAPPIYIQEKILPRAIIEDLRRQTKERRTNGDAQFDFFHDFNGLPDPEAKTEFYAHDQNWSNRMILGDSLLVMASLAEREGLRGKVQCIYLDPPYGIKFNSNWQPSTKSRKVDDGRAESVSREPEVVRAFRDTRKAGVHTYLGYLRDRLIICRDLLSPSGSIFVQIGDENVHRIRAVLDEVFTPECFVSEILVKKKGAQKSTLIDPVNDFILWYSRSPRADNAVHFQPLYERREIDADTIGEFSRIELPDGRIANARDAQVVYENLKASGVQNTKKGETLKFEWLRPFASRSGLIQFEGRYQEKGEPKRAAICIDPEYDTVGYELVRRAAREAADLFDMLIICGFAFAPEVDDTRLNFGALTVLKARMNQDLRMADKLKATGAGNLFVVFGEPDIVIHERDNNMLQVEIRGMDIFDPTTGEVRSSGGKDLMNDVAAWFIDHDYDEESFFVRQAYFVGDDPYDALKRALKAEIDETAWAELNSTISHPFPKPERGRICVKVINHFGDEVQKVFPV